MIKSKTLFTLLFSAGLVGGLTLPSIADAISVGSGRDTIEMPALENTYEVDPIDTAPDYDEGDHACEGARHVHYHTNTSTDTYNNEYWGIVHSFAIVLDTDYPGANPATNDFLENVDTTTLLCTNGDSTYIDCSFDKESTALGTEIWSTTGGRWSGVTITYDTLDWIDGNPRGLIWEYATDAGADKNDMPWLSADASKLEAVSWDSLDDYYEEYTVTTESWTKTEFYVFHNDGSYEHVYTEDVDPDGDGDDDETGVDPDGDYIYWYGLNARIRSNFEACEEPPATCEDLEITPSTLSVSDVFSDTDFSLTATNSDGDDITDEVQITYEAFAYDGSAATGDIMTGPLNRVNNGAGPVESGDTEIAYNDSLPGDRLTAFVSDYNGESYEDACSVEIEFPYCTDLNFLDPSSTAFISSGDVDINLEIEAEASTGEDWPYSVDYQSTDSDSTFDGNSPVYATTDWTIDSYQSDEAASVWVELTRYDVANACSDSFSYGITPTCEYLEIIVPSATLTCEEMTAGDVEITWESEMSSGAPSTGPWLVTSSNGAGTFSLTPGGAVIGTGSATVSVNTVYYTGEDGDTIQVMDLTYPVCTDSIDSEPCDEETPYCDDLTLSEPYIENADGTTSVIDLTDEADLALLYADTQVCWDYSLTVSDASYTGRIVAEGYTDSTASALSTSNLTLTVNETAGGDIGNPATVPGVTGFTTYTGTLCWTNFEENNYLSIFMLGDELVCSDEDELPPLTPPEEEPVCVDLQMEPDSYTMSATDEDAGTIPVTIDVQGSDSTWTGTLVVEYSGSGALFYTDGSPSTFSDGHLEIPVSGSSSSVIVFYRSGEAGDTVRSYIVSESDPCNDAFTITQSTLPPDEPICEEVYFEDDVLEVDLTCSDEETTLCTQIDDDGSRTIEVCYETADGEDGTYTYDGDTYTGCEEITVTGTPGSTVCEDIVFEEVCEGSEIDVRETVDGETQVCEEIDTELETEVCEDVEFEEDELEVDYDCEDTEANLCVTGDEDGEREVEVCYEDEDGDDGEWSYDGENYEGCEEIVIEADPGEEECVEIEFEEVCEDAEITVYEDNEVCEEIGAESVEMGEFSKFIYTFNFAAEKNSYSEENIFFSHDEDRAFYTLEYNPTGDEDKITFTDDMWTGELEGRNGDGSESGGYVRLATSWSELVTGYSGTYDYEAIENFGFGYHPYETDSDGDPLLLEEKSGNIASLIESSFSSSGFMTFVPYIKFPSDWDMESVMIQTQCEYDEEGDLETETVCYDPGQSPETTGDVVIENAGTVEEEYGRENDKDEAITIRIRYVGVVVSNLDCDASDDEDLSEERDECLTEEFENNASVEVYEGLTELTASAKLVVLCSYLMTQNAGDVYLEASLDAGSDISCIFVDEDTATSDDYRNVDALIILEDQGSSSSSTSTTNTYAEDTVSLCDDKADSNTVIGNLSSYVCEIVAKVSEIWSSTTVESTTDSRIDQATRNADTNQVASDSTYSTWEELQAALTNENNSESNILYFNGDLSTDGKMTLGDLTVPGDITVPAGAWTIVVQNADLHLTENMAYASMSNPGDYKNMPSVAFVVQGGDIYIHSSALRLVGVYYTNQKFDGDERSAVNEQLTVDGSFYGNIQTLIDRANYVGPPTIDGGGVVIRYDSRILLNTPPGLSEYVDINTEKAVN